MKSDGDTINREKPGIETGELNGLDLIEEIRSLPRVKPRPGFRLKAYMKSYGQAGTKAAPRGVERSPSAGGGSVLSLSLRYAACAVLVLLLTVVIFTGLSVIARESKPGDALYSIKKASEKIDMAFTWERFWKAEKKLGLAGRRLAEIDKLLTAGETDPEVFAALTHEYEQNRKSASVIIAQQAEENEARQELESRLDDLDRQEYNLARKAEVVAGAAGAPEKATAAAVTVIDTSGRASLDGGKSKAAGRTDSAGEFQFTYELSDEGDPGELSAQLELDGIKELVPLCPGSGRSKTEDGSYAIEVTPTTLFIKKGEEERFKVKLIPGVGKTSERKVLRVEDRTGQGLINGSSGCVLVETDGGGNAEFGLKKIRTSNVSTISIEINDGTWKSFGDVMDVGLIETGVSEARASALIGFTIDCSPELKHLKPGTHEISLTVFKKYEKLSDYLR